MKFPSIESKDFQGLVDRGVIYLKNEEKDENRSRELALLIWFIFTLGILPTVLSTYLFVDEIISNDILRAFKVSIFLVFFAVLEVLFFVSGFGYYSYSKNPSSIFWKYFVKGKLNLVLIGTRKIDGREYVFNEFMSKKFNYFQPTFLLSVNIRRDIHRKAMELNKRVYSIAFDKDGNRKFVSVDGLIEDADEDVIIVARFINALYGLYREDISRLQEKDRARNQILEEIAELEERENEGL